MFRLEIALERMHLDGYFGRVLIILYREERTSTIQALYQITLLDESG